MRERTKRFLEQFVRALTNLKIGVDSSVDDLDIDGTIKRFELCYELAWKLIKEYLEDLGIICKSPRQCFKYAKENNLIDDEETWLNMIEDRNYLVHTYSMEQSREIFKKIKEKYISSFESLSKSIFKSLKEYEG